MTIQWAGEGTVGRRDHVILYVDDCAENLAVFRRNFESEYAIMLAHDYTQALDLIHQSPPDILLTDYRLSDAGPTGIDLCHQVRQSHPRIMRALITGYADEETMLEAINHGGVHRLLTRPWRRQGLRRSLDELIEQIQKDRTIERLKADLFEKERMAMRYLELRRLVHDMSNMTGVLLFSAHMAQEHAHQSHTLLEPPPLRGIIDELGVMQEGLDHLKRLHRQARHMERQPDDPLHTVVPVASQLERVISLVRTDTARRLIIDTDCPADLYVKARTLDLSRILINLIHNARNAMLEAKASGRPFRVEITAQREGDEVLITVQDHGPGVPPRLAPCIFSPTFTTRATRGGTGLGLSTALALARDNGGDLRLLPSGGAGATFELRLRRAPVSVRSLPS